MTLKSKKQVINEILETFFGRDDKISFYFLKKRRRLSRDEVIIPFKTRKKVNQKKISDVESLIRDKIGEPKLKLLRWSEVIDKIVPSSQIFKIPFFDSTNRTEKSHPWRLCPIGEHWVKRHPKKLRSGKVTDHDGHCRKNKKSKGDFYHADELILIAQNHFDSISSDPHAMPIPHSLKFPDGNKYDLLIAGWTKFWNDVLNPEELLSPDLVKALIATESSFKTPKDQKSKDGNARGLIQITENTRKILQDLKGELKDHHIELSIEESRDPITNIAAGIRWLHYKKKYRERRLKRKVTWEEAIMEYKGISSQVGKVELANDIMKNVNDFYNTLKKTRNSK